MSFGGRASKFASSLISNNSYVAIFQRALFLAVRDQIICIDDVERVGSGLHIMAVLGLIDTLSKEKGCKVVVLLNQEQLEKNRTVFDDQIEKVADVMIKFDPTPAEAAAIAIDASTTFNKWLSEYTQKLGIINIRVIKKAEAFLRRVLEILPTHDDLILQQAAQTLTLATYAKFQPKKFQTGEVAPLSLIRSHNQMIDDVAEIDRRRTEDAEQNQHLKSILKHYGFGHVDEFDLVLIDGVERGFFDAEAVQRCADLNENTVRLSRKASAFGEAWELTHSSFSIEENDCLETIERSAYENCEALSPSELNATIVWLKQFGRTDNARRLLQFYLDHRKADPSFWNLSSFPFTGMISDQEVKDAFEKKYAAVAPTPLSPDQMLIEIGGRQAWNPNDLAILARLSSAEYKEILKRIGGREFRQIMYAFTLFREIANPDENLRIVVSTFTDALKEIAKENNLNAWRVKAYGVRLD